MTFIPNGRVIDVETEAAEGLAPTRLREAGDAAAWRYRINAYPDIAGRKLRQP